MILVLLDTLITLTGEGDLSVGRLGQPVSIAIDVEHDLNERLAVALVHSRYATTNMRASAGGGVCIYGNLVCDRAYDNVGAEAHYALRDDLRATAGLHVTSIDDVDLGLKLAVRWHRTVDRFTFFTHPTVMIPDRVWLPIGVEARPIEHLALGVHTGVTAAFDALGDWELPLAGTLAYESRHFTVGASYAFHKLTGGADQPASRAPIYGVDYRVVHLWFGVAF